MSLGGVKDEAEIRGHRRTYVGALPGRIIQSIKQVGSNNPVFMMDEIDKVGAISGGIPPRRSLRCSTPSRTTPLATTTLNLPFDLSKVMFITTANQMDPIPRQL